MRRIAAPVAFSLLLVACGGSNYDRVTTGAGTGAGTGALIGLIGGPVGVLVGAGIGAGVGAVAGGETSQDQLDLGKPVWRDDGSAPAAQGAASAQGSGQEAVTAQSVPPGQGPVSVQGQSAARQAVTASPL